MSSAIWVAFSWPVTGSCTPRPAQPYLERVALVAALWRPVEDWVVAHQELEPASPGLVGLVDEPVIQDEHAEAWALSQIAEYVGAGFARVVLDDRRQRLEYRRDRLARLLCAA